MTWTVWYLYVKLVLTHFINYSFGKKGVTMLVYL